MRNRSSQGFVGVRARCEQSPELLAQGAGFVFYALLDAAVDRYFPFVEELENLVDGIETQNGTDRVRLSFWRASVGLILRY